MSVGVVAKRFARPLLCLNPASCVSHLQFLSCAEDLDTEWISTLVVRELRASRSSRQIIVVTHNANIPVNGDAERVVVLENTAGAIRLRCTTRRVLNRNEIVTHCGAIEVETVRGDIQNIMEGGIRAFVLRERKYNTEVLLADALRH
jgi:hypothetical protein